MRTSFFTLFALGGLFATSIANPMPASGDNLQRKINRAQRLLTALETTVMTYTGAINATLAGTSSNADKVAAIGTEINGLTAAITATRAEITRTDAKRDITSRQSVGSITTTLTTILQEIFSTLTSVVGTLGLTPLLSFLNPLVASLGGLILSLEVVVNNLLAVVTALLDGLLTGLGLGLGGLIL